ncbi:MAG: L,D-transpeptidase [Streptosporangiaceae bacterium]
MRALMMPESDMTHAIHWRGALLLRYSGATMASADSEHSCLTVVLDCFIGCCAFANTRISYRIGFPTRSPFFRRSALRDRIRVNIIWRCTTIWAKPVIVLAILAAATGCEAASPAHSASAPKPVLPKSVSAAQLAQLPIATTFGRSPRAPQDSDPSATATGIVLHPTKLTVVYARPGGPPVARLPTTEIKSPTWVPVIQSQTGWDRVLLPIRPNHSTGWLYTARGGLQIAYSAYRIAINLAVRRLTISDAGRKLGSWTVAVGAPGTPTPAGRTFLMASLAPVHPTYSPLILPLGAHSAVLTTFGGGPGTVALHGWPDPAVFGHAVTHGCVRVPLAALRVLSRVPLGSSVVITS